MRQVTLFAAAQVAAALLFAGAPKAFAQTVETPAPAASNVSASLEAPKTKKLAIVLFPRYQTLDVFGPVEMWSRLDNYEVVTVSEHGGSVTSAQGIETVTNYSFEDAPQFEIIMIPGGMGTRTEVNNPVMLDFLRSQDKGSELTTSVCTGSAVLAKAGLLDGHKATSNKMAWKFATSQDEDVLWQSHARWVEDGKYITSSGISAGTDMALGLVEKIDGREKAEQVARTAEYIWNDDPSNDPFAVEETNMN
ncbi:MAG: DJ-1/PfpI family protein [Alphaproteobacteria bacterium]|nr:DJ-1/PfpI family protein [Alphaproteobacteria bacterium]MBU2083206.1 DJ-1/PfpI family protein [Alphaproteobacteria bacterium]MBU2144495.1 DJ-1/PfpI family protein [Alphaproteobacteria bacterium]MBU2195490.1 DJ-1/PfpI family protein [Alphaproteobacteria bacterium]